jgi:cephalosporin hydroxylase
MKTYSEIVKESGKTDKNTSHTYGPWYDLWLPPYREKSVNVLEVGVCVFGGGCILGFAEYFQQGTIWGVDINKTPCVDAVFNHPRIKFFEGDAYHTDMLKNFGNTKFDIIVDDASHEVQDQLKLLKMLRPYMADGGFYVIEDVCTGHWLPHLQEVWDMGLKQQIIDMSTKTCYDNTLIRFEAR